MVKRRELALAVSLALGSSLASAEWSNDWVRISGYGTAAVTKNASDKTVYRLGGLQPSGARDGYDGGALNKIGVQATITATPWLSATAQVVSQRQYDNGYDPVFDWAFVKVKPLDSVTVRMGRLVLPGFMVSESRNVGYVNTMVTPPIDVYTLLPMTKFDGMDVNWRINAGPVVVNVTPYIGRRREPNPVGMVLQLDDLRGLNMTAEWESWAFRAGVTKGKSHSPNEPAKALWEGLRSTGNATAIAIAEDYELQHKDASFAGMGVQYDDGKILAAGEYVQRKTKSFVPDATAWYLMGGYRIKNFTPYILYSRLKNDSPTSDERGGTFLGGAYQDAINGALSALASDHNSMGVGVRWDLYKNTALKFQYDHVKINNNQGDVYGLAVGSQGPSPRLNFYTLALDFVF